MSAEINDSMSFEEMLNASEEKRVHAGSIVKGIVTSISANEIQVDIGAKQTGFVKLIQPGKLCSVLAAVPGDDLVATFRAWAGDQRRQHTVMLYALYGALHGFIVQDLKGVVFERKQLSDGNLLHLLPLLFLPGFLGGENVICPFQRHV